MKINILLITIFIIPFISAAQNQGFFLLPEFGVSLPGQDFKASKMLSKTGYQVGIHIDKKWKNLGLGMYVGFNSNGMAYDYQLPASNSSLSIELLQNINRGSLSQLVIGIGPLISFRVTEKIGIDLSAKFGISRIFQPDFEEKIKVGTTNVEEYTLYSTNSADARQKINPMLMSSIRVHYKLGDKMTLFLSGNFNHVWDVRHSYAFLDGAYSPSMSSEALLQTLRTSASVREIRKCNVNSPGITTGVSFQLGGSKPSPQNPAFPIPEFPDKDSILASLKAECSKLKVIVEKQDNARNPCCYKIVLLNNLDEKSPIIPAAFQVSIMNGNVTEVYNSLSGWTQAPTNVPQKVKNVNWKSSTLMIPQGQSDLATVCVEGLTPMWFQFSWLDKAGKELCRDSMQLNDCVNESEDFCDKPLIKNGGFETNTTTISSAHWSAGYGSPNFMSSPTSGFIDVGHVEATGNISHGDAIAQVLNPINKIQKGKKYLLTVGVRFLANENVLDYARIRAIAFNGPLPVSLNKHPEVGTNLAVIGRSIKIRDCGEWYIIEFFVWEAHKDFQSIALNVFTNDGTVAKVSFDNVSLCEVNYDPCEEVQLDANEKPIRPAGLPPAPPNLSCQIEEEEDEYQTGALSDLYGGAPYFYDGTTNWYANAMDKCFSIGGTLPDEVTNYNCDDSLKKAGIDMTCDELQRLVENPDLKQFDNYIPPKLPPIPGLPNAPPCDLSPNDAGNLAFGGKDIIYIHGLELGHVLDRILGLKPEAWADWQTQPDEFYDDGYYKKAAKKTWKDHIEYFTKNNTINENNYKNRYLVVSYNCSQRLDVAVHSVLTQIWRAMAYGDDVVYQPGDHRERRCFGREFVIISQSTGAMVADVMLTIANDSKTSSRVAKKYGKIGFIADRCKGHIARRGAFTGSDLATILVALANPNPRTSSVALAMMSLDGLSNIDITKPGNYAVIRNSILVDLVPPIARNLWGPYIDRVPIKVLTVSGGHPTFFSKQEIDLLIGIAPIAVGGVASSALLTAALSMKYITHPGFDDGVITTDCATGRKSTFLTPSTYQTTNPAKAYDMGIKKLRAVGYFLDQKKKTDWNTFRSAATPYLSPAGMVQPVNSYNLNQSYNNHFTFVQAAGEHWIKKDLISCNYNSTAIEGSDNFEEQLVVFDPSLFHPTTGIVHPSIIALVKEDVKGKTIPIPYIKIKKVKGIPYPTVQFKPFYIWKRTYHNLKRPYYLINSDHGCMLDCDYVYRYLFKN